jgi:hypothetical protein
MTGKGHPQATAAQNFFITPAKAGVYLISGIDSRVRGNDSEEFRQFVGFRDLAIC